MNAQNLGVSSPKTLGAQKLPVFGWSTLHSQSDKLVTQVDVKMAKLDLCRNAFNCQRKVVSEGTGIAFSEGAARTVTDRLLHAGEAATGNSRLAKVEC